MNRELVAHILRKGKAMAPDRFPSLPRGQDKESQDAALLILDSWVESLGTVNLPWQVWNDAVVLWANTLVGERMVTPKDLVQAAYLVRDRWENDPSKRPILEQHRVECLNRNYSRMGLERVDASALPQHMDQPPQAVHEASRRQQSEPERIGAAGKFIRRSQQ